MNVVHQNVLVEIPEVETKRNGIALPESEIESKRIGVVVRYGEAVPETLKTLFNAKPKVEYKQYYDGGEIKRDGKSYLVMNYKDILIID